MISLLILLLFLFILLACKVGDGFFLFHLYLLIQYRSCKTQLLMLLDRENFFHLKCILSCLFSRPITVTFFFVFAVLIICSFWIHVSFCCISCRYNINWNYGLLPQTWEDPSLANPEVEGAFGDNDPGSVSICLESCDCFT